MAAPGQSYLKRFHKNSIQRLCFLNCLLHALSFDSALCGFFGVRIQSPWHSMQNKTTKILRKKKNILNTFEMEFDGDDEKNKIKL